MSDQPGSRPARPDLEAVVEQGDLDELVRAVDRLCAGRDWDGLVELRDRCRWAVERGKQLWPAASLAEYRLALEAPGRHAAAVLVEGAGRFALGPLPEVAASTHTWDELAPHLPASPMGALAAHERVLRGEDLRGDDRVPVPAVLDLPMAIEPWEPAYALATYRADGADFPAPAIAGPHAGGSGAMTELSPAGARAEPADDPDATDALLAVVAPWVTESNGRAEAVAVRGDASSAVAALGARTARLVELTTADAVALIAWAGASGGAHGRRRGGASGRFNAWWVLAALAGATDDWPLDGEEVGMVAGDLRWYAWDRGEPRTGWNLHLAVEDPAEGYAWAISASDAT